MTDSLLTKINAAVAAANEAEKIVETAKTEFVSRSNAVGLLLLEAKKLHPAVKDFEAFLKKVHGLKLSRAYDLLRLAGGRATDEQLREETRKRVQKHREKKKLPKPEPNPKPFSVTDPRVTERPEPIAQKPTEEPPRIKASPEINVERERAANAQLDQEPPETAATALKQLSKAFYAALAVINKKDAWPSLDPTQTRRRGELVIQMQMGLAELTELAQPKKAAA